MTFLEVLVAIALIYLAGGLFTTVAVAMMGPGTGKVTIRELAMLPKVFVMWPAVVGMGVVFAVIMLGQRWDFAQEAKTLKNKLKGQQQSGQSDDPPIA